MSRKNYYEILGLDFDPPEDKDKVINEAIETWKKRKENALSNETIDSKRAEIKYELSLYNDMVTVLGDKKTRKAEANELKKIRTQQLENILDIIIDGATGTLEVTKPQIQNIYDKLGLSKGNIEKIYKSKGFAVKKPINTNINNVFMNKSIFDNYTASIKNMKKINSIKYPWFSNTNDIYDLICFMMTSDNKDVESYHKKRTSELLSICETTALKFASDMSDEGHAINDLFTKGKTDIFKTEDDRRKYDMTLEREKYEPFFAMIKSAPDVIKKDSYFADSCIKKIQKGFPDYNIALALYNRAAGLTQDPYEPMEALIYVTCGSCKTPQEFRTREEALKAKCSVCGAPLYVECPSCHKKVPSIADRCSCGFAISEMQFFDEYLSLAKLALSQMDLNEALKQFTNAKNAYPNHPKLSALEKEITNEQEKYKVHLDKLNSFMSLGNYMEAEAFVNKLLASTPQLNLNKQKSDIKSKLEQARKMMPTDSLPLHEKANRCEDILMSVKDYKPALDLLNSIRPRRPLNLQAALSAGSALSCTLSWNATGDKGVKYLVVRKENGEPKTFADGVVLVKDTEQLNYKDTTLKPGIYYGYAVFACRRNNYSDPLVTKVIHFSDIDAKTVQTSAEDGVCRLSWSLPKNAVGVRILKCTNATPAKVPGGGTTILTSNASANYDDFDVKNNTKYGYRLQCIYPFGNGFEYSEGYTIILTPEPKPVAIKNVSAQVDANTVNIRWAPTIGENRSIRIREVLTSLGNEQSGKVLLLSDINKAIGNGRILNNALSSDGKTSFSIPSNTTIKIAIISESGSLGIISSVVSVSSIGKLEINKSETKIDTNKLCIKLTNLPKYLDKIHYIVAQKNGKTVPWATKENIKDGILKALTVQQYQKDGMIIVPNVPKTELYITIIGEYKLTDGSIVYADPAKLRVNNKEKDEIRCEFKWASGFFGKKPKDCKLVLTSKADSIPELYVVYKSDGHIPMNFNDPKNIILHTVKEMENGFKNNEYTYKFEDSIWKKVGSGTQLRIFIPEENSNDYKIVHDVETCKVP